MRWITLFKPKRVIQRIVKPKKRFFQKRFFSLKPLKNKQINQPSIHKIVSYIEENNALYTQCLQRYVIQTKKLFTKILPKKDLKILHYLIKNEVGMSCSQNSLLISS